MPSQKICFNRERKSRLLSMTLLLLLHIEMIVEVTGKNPKHHQLSLPKLDSAANIGELNSEIQRYAFHSFKGSRTGEIYSVSLPSNLTGLQVQAVRLRTGSLRRHGLAFNEFWIPAGASTDAPHPVRVLLIYRKFERRPIYSSKSYTLVAPVLGIKIYSASNLSAPDASPELQLTATGPIITVRIPLFSKSERANPFCASFDSSGSLSISNVTSPPNLCSFSHLGDFSLVIPSAEAPAPQPYSSSPSLQHPPPVFPKEGSKNKRQRNAWKIAVGSAVGAFAVLGIAGVVAAMAARSFQKTRIAKMEEISENGEILQTAPIGNNSRAPTAGGSRTRPHLENDYSL